jgi:uncharacterized metal-binding protein
MESSNVCAGGDALIFACSGAADVGAVADAAARKMTQRGIGKMFCLAGIGGRIEPILNKTAEAQKILAIDGCSLNCVKRCLEEAAFSEFKHFQLGAIGMAKGQTPATEDNIDKVIAKGTELLA